MFAVVDIGSNSVKVLVAKIQRGVVVPALNLSFVTRLGRGLDRNGCLSEESLEKTQKAFRAFHAKMSSLKVKKVEVVATEAVRVASNQDRVLQMVKDIFGVKLRVLKGHEEAHLSFMGAAQVLKFDKLELKDAVFLDLGGASTEIGVLSPKEIFHSFPLGAVRAFEGLNLPSGVISDFIWEKKRNQLKKQLTKLGVEKLVKKIGKRKVAVVIGGTLMQAARSSGAKESGESTYHTSLRDMEIFCKSLRALSLNQRIRRYKVEKGRADILPAGILVIEECLKLLGMNEFYVTGLGLRHGVLSSSGSSS